MIHTMFVRRRAARAGLSGATSIFGTCLLLALVALAGLWPREAVAGGSVTGCTLTHTFSASPLNVAQRYDLTPADAAACSPNGDIQKDSGATAVGSGGGPGDTINGQHGTYTLEYDGGGAEWIFYTPTSSASGGYNESISFYGDDGGSVYNDTANITILSSGSAPDAPTIGTATAGNGQATITFSAPGSDGGSPITGYTATSNPGGKTGTCSASPCTVTGLTNGTAYTFTVTATNANGTSASSSASNSVTPTAPLTTLTYSAGTYDFTKGQADSTGTPTHDGGPLTGCTVSPTLPGGLTISPTDCTISGTPAVLQTLPVSYTVTASNASGSAQATVTIVVNDEPPTSLTYASGTYDFTVGQASTTGTPTRTGGAPTFCTATPALPGGLSINPLDCTISGTPTVRSVTTSYAVTVSNSGGSTIGSVSITVDAAKPGAPTIGAATAGDGQALVNFTPPAFNGGATITQYTATSDPGSLAGSCTTSPCVVTGLVNGIAYTFTVTATNSAGTGVPSTASTSVTPQASQTITFANPGPQNFGTTPTLSATASSGQPVTFTSSTTSVCTITSGGLLTTVSTGTCTILADQGGNGAYQPAPQVSQSFTIIAVAPGAPTIGTATAGDGQALVSFTPPAFTGGATITGYTVTSSPGGLATPCALSPCTVTGLSNGTAYAFTVMATNSAGTGTASGSSNSVTPKASQDITNFMATPANPVYSPGGTFHVSATGGGSINPVVFAIDPSSSAVCSISGATVTMLSAGTCTVTANQAGDAGHVAAPQVTLGVIITNPPAPTTSNVNASAAYNTATPIDLSSAIGGSDITAVTIGTLPSHGTAVVSGETVTYTPSSTFYGGTDTFTYTATNPGGTSAPATVTVTVGKPAAPTAANKTATTPYNTAAAIDLSSSITGVDITAVAIGTMPAHGTVSVSGETVTYTPASSYYGGTDTFTYTATNPGGTSAPATVTVTVGTPAAPAAAAKSTTTPYNTAAAIDLSGSITGVDITAVTIGTMPAHGTVSVSGETVTYTPASSYYGGTDTFTYTATNPGGTSAPATVTVTVGKPAAPTAANKTATTPYNTAASIDLSGSITGVGITGVTIGTAPSHGTVSVSGETVTYTPDSTYYGGSDNFTYTAINPGGTSAPATVTVTVGAPAAPTAAAKSVTTPYDAVASIDLSGSITGAGITAVTIGTVPTHGTVSVSGETVTYTPSSTYYGGTDSFTYTATNPGGTSAPATVTITVGAPAAPAVSAKSVTTAYNTAATIDLSGSITGVDITAVTIGTAPTHGSVSVSGETVTYTPSPTYYGGSDSFTYTATNPGGTSAPATVTITIGAPAAPTAAAKSVTTAYNTVATIDLSGSITGAGITAVTIGTAPTHGTVSVSGETVTYTPSSTYYGGSDSFTYTATNSGGTSAPATVTITVGAPAAPTVAAKSVTTAYDTAAAIDLSGSITGVDITTVTIGTAPTHGTVSVSGETVTYTPSSTYYGGSDSFTYTATNPGGTSAPATVTITVGAPTAPTAAAKSVSTAYNTAATIDLSGSITGVDITAVTIGTAPTHGTVSVSGETVTYTPSSTYYGGSDSFTYTATNPGGTSAPATVTITVGAPAAPTAATKSVTTAYNTAATIDLSGSITGVDITAVTIGTAPTHGTVSVSGKTVTYTPSSTYYGGSDSFTYTATNPGGTSAPATVTITVGAPEAPTAAARSVSTAYNTAATIDLSGSITGVDITAVTIGTAPTHGTVSVSGKTVTYTPSASYYGGSDSFTYTATNPGGTSAPATVTITVGLPPVPVVAARNATTAYNTAANVDLSGAITGVDITSIAVASAPSHGSVSVSGKTVTYTPSATFYGGTDSFTYTATNPGGTSAPATVTITVTPLSVPTAQALSVTTTTGASVQIQATAGATGPAPFTGVSVAQAPAHGQATASGEQITYTPAAGFTGTDHFTYQIANHFGSSTAATVTVTVTAAGQASAPDGTVTLTTKPATPVSTDLGHIVTGQYVSSTVLGLSPGGAGQVSISQPTTLSFTSVAGFHGLAQVTVLLTAADGHMATVDVLVLVSSQPDPSKNPDVLGLINAQTMEAQRFAQNQLDNIRQRLESLHDGNQQLFSSTLSMSLNGKPLQAPRMAGAGRLPGQRSIDGSDDRSGLATTTQPQSLMTMRPGIGGAGDNMMMLPDAAAPASDAADTSAGHAPPSRGPNGLAAWIDGTAAFGSFDSYRQAAGFDADSIAINTGIDQRLGEHGLFGLSLGYNHDRSTIANDGTRSIAQGYSAAMYGSFAPTPKTYLDAVLGGGGLSFDSRRRDSDNGSYLLGHRNGSQWFGSLTAGYEYHHQRWMISPYGRLEWSYSTLNGFAEKGDVVDALAYGQQTVRTSLAVLGVRTSGMIETAHAVLVPRARLEVGHDFQGTSDTTLSYAFVPSAGSWNVLTNPYSANGTSVQAGLGLDIQLPRSLTLTTDYSFMTQPHGHSQMIRFGLNKKF